MTTKRIKLTTACIIGTTQVPNLAGDVVDVTEGEGNALIAVGFAEDAKGQKLHNNSIVHHVGGNTPPVSGQDAALTSDEKTVAKNEGDAVANAAHAKRGK